MKTIYLSGPMTGIKDNNYPWFNEVADKLKSQGYSVLNPAVIKLHPQAEWKDYMRQAITMLCAADEIYMLEGWENSQGAQVEHNLAKILEMKIRHEVEK